MESCVGRIFILTWAYPGHHAFRFDKRTPPSKIPEAILRSHGRMRLGGAIPRERVATRFSAQPANCHHIIMHLTGKKYGVSRRCGPRPEHVQAYCCCVYSTGLPMTSTPSFIFIRGDATVRRAHHCTGNPNAGPERRQTARSRVYSHWSID